MAFESEELSSYECNLGASQGFIICSLSRFETLDYHGHIHGHVLIQFGHMVVDVTAEVVVDC